MHVFIPLPEIRILLQTDILKRRIELMYSRIEWDLSGRKGSWK
ncbi:MAG: hypothetical protein Ct9H90mP6_08320 [Gammaproteobacteria bacterium]|nr:MAG: hypothetical protein Ct9H90mP6_08320 [Gammaproteobacteria bacterium]